MATLNGGLSPAPQHSSLESANDDAITLSAKRKRDDERTEGQPAMNGVSVPNESEQTAASIEDAQRLVRDLVDVLKIYDTTPSILTQPLPDGESAEPQPKRQKATDGSEPQSSATILTLASANFYTSLDGILKDIDTAVSAVADKVRMPNGSELANKVSLFGKRAHDLVTREKAFAAKTKADGASTSSSHKVNGVGAKASTEINVSSSNSETVLTLYGNAPGPKQLFSSFRAEVEDADRKDLMQTLRRAPLPPGILTTDIVAIPFNNLVEDNKRITLGEAFPVPSNVPTLQPPKPSKVANTRSSTVSWYQPAAADLQRRPGSYFTQNVTPGAWLDYSNASPPQTSRRKQTRDRTMSLGGAKIPQVDPEPAETETARLEAAFRSAYSGFAPTKDDSAAVAPTGLIDRIWWQEVGQKSYERMIENETNLELAIDPNLEVKPVVDNDEELKQFELLAETWEDDCMDSTRLPVEARYEKSFEDKTLDEILEGTSELLETLSSFQRKRHMSLNSSNRPTGLLAGPDTVSVGTPTKPTDSEQNTYEIIRAQLKIMIESLPPYYVAKLNGDQLADLNISTKIEIQTNNCKGTLEEDDSSRAKTSTGLARAQPPSLHHRNSASALYGNQYSTPQPPNATPHQYYGGGASTPVRPNPNLQRAPSTAQMPYQPQRPAAAQPYRPHAYGTPNYQQQAPRPIQHQYPPTSSSQFMQTPTAQSYMRPANQGYQGAPQSAPPAQMNGGYRPQQAYGHQTPSQNGMDYRYSNGTQIPRQSSPPGQTYGQTSRPPSGQQYPPYAGSSTPTPNMQQNRQQFGQNQNVNGGTAPASQGQYAQTRSQQTTGYSTFMSQEQQQMMVERQRAQLANQTQARAAAQAAQAALQTGSPSTHAAQVNGGSAVAAGL